MKCLYCNKDLSEQLDACNFCGKPQPVYEGPEGYEWDPNSGFYYQTQGTARILFDPISGDYSNEPVFDGGGTEDKVVYAPPEGFLFDEESGLYLREAIALDDSGAEILYTQWFDPVTGSYTKSKRIQKRNQNTVLPNTKPQKQKKITTIAAIAVIVVVGTAVALGMEWISLPLLMREDTLTSQPEEALETVQQSGNDENDSNTGAGETAYSEPSDEAQESSPVVSESGPPDTETLVPEESGGNMPAEMSSPQAFRIDKEASSSPCPVTGVEAQYDGTDRIIITYTIAQDFQEYATVLFTYGQADDAKAWATEMLRTCNEMLPTWAEHADYMNYPFGVSSTVDEIILYDGFTGKEEEILVFLFTFDADYNAVAYATLHLDFSLV